MTGQLSFSLDAPPPAGPDLPAPVAEILRAARSIAFTTKIVRGCWGIGVGVKRRWTLVGDCCCALSAYLIVQEAVAGESDRSPVATAARLLGVTHGDLFAFVDGYDGRIEHDSDWRRYGARVAREVVTT